jgi:hypothetical protein
MEHEGQSTVTITAAIQWSLQPNARPGSVVGAHRTTAVRGFARYLLGIDPDTQIPVGSSIPAINAAGVDSGVPRGTR